MTQQQQSQKLQILHEVAISDFDFRHKELYTITFDHKIRSQNLIDLQQTQITLNKDIDCLAIAVHPKIKNYAIIAISTNIIEGGISKKKIQIMEIINKKIEKSLCKVHFLIKELIFSPSGNYISIIGVKQKMGAIFKYKDKTIMRCRPGHTSSLLSMIFSPKQQYACSSGADGYFKIYKLNEQNETFTLINTQKLSSEINNISDQRLQVSFNQNEKIIACSGKSQLILITKQNDNFKLSIEKNIYHNQDITICVWISSELLLTSGLDHMANIWNYENKQKIYSIDKLIYKLRVFDECLLGMDDSGSIFKIICQQLNLKKQLLVSNSIKKEKSKGRHKKSNMDEQFIHQKDQNNDKMQIQNNLSASEPQTQNNMIHEQQIEEQENDQSNSNQQEQIIQIQNKFPFYHINQATRLDFKGNRFLLYNLVGCIYESIYPNRIITVEYFQKKQMKKNVLFRDKEIKYFDLDQKYILYAHTNYFGLLGQKTWELNMNGIKGVRLSSQFLVVYNQQQIKILSFVKTQIQGIAFDRYIIAMDVYYNLLIIVYHESISGEGCKNLRMKFYSINNPYNKHLKECKFRLENQLRIKKFGVSKEGLIYYQDTSGQICIYIFEKNEWVNIYKPQSHSPKDFNYCIIGIKDYEVSVFKLSKKEYEPKVDPRSTTQQFDICSLMNNDEQNPKLTQLKWKYYFYMHQKFRFRYWNKYKLSKESAKNIFANILTQFELELRQQQLKKEFLAILKNQIENKNLEMAFRLVKLFVINKIGQGDIVSIFKLAEHADQYIEKICEIYSQRTLKKDQNYIQYIPSPHISEVMLIEKPKQKQKQKKKKQQNPSIQINAHLNRSNQSKTLNQNNQIVHNRFPNQINYSEEKNIQQTKKRFEAQNISTRLRRH